MSVYDIVNEKILHEMEKGIIPWRRPWVGVKGAHNRITGKTYSILNQVLLSETGPGEYASFDQWKKLGARIKKGSKGSIIVFFKMEEKEEEDGSKTMRPILRYTKVFHITMTEGIEPLEQKLPAVAEPLEEADDLIEYYLSRENIAFYEEMGNVAYYDPKKDEIHIPLREQFSSTEDRYETIFHETIHSCRKRLDIHGLQNLSFGSHDYGMEELIAEIGSAYIMHSLGIYKVETMQNNAAYIQNWMAAIKADNRLFVRAAAAAEKAVNFVRGT